MPRVIRPHHLAPLSLVFLAMNVEAGVASHVTKITDQELFAALDLTRAGLAPVRQAVEAGDDAAAADAWAAYMRTRSKPTMHFDRERWPAFVRHEFPQLAPAFLAEADKLVAGRIAHGTVTLPVKGRAIQWLHNPRRDTTYVSIVGSYWFMNPLGRAYLLSGDEKYVETFAWMFESWYDARDAIMKHQGGLGFNPMYRAYYPGIRARVLCDNYYCLAPSPKLSPRLHVKIMKELLGCAAWLHRQERRYRVGNQQVAAVLGLGMVGLVFPEFKQSQAWLARAEQRMKEHLRRDFYPDGGHKELCTQYHKTCLRDMAYVALTSAANGRPSLFEDADAAAGLERAYDWLARLVLPTGETPPLHSAVYSTDYAVYMGIGALHFQRPDFLWLARQYWKRGEVPNQKAPFAFANYIINERMSRAGLQGLHARPPDYLSTHLDKSGFAIMRTGRRETDRYLLLQYGWANTGHAYPGALHFLLEMNGEVVATGPGSPRSYRHPAYPYCHSTRSHNVVSIDLQDHAKVKGLAPGGKLRRLADLPGAWYARATHEGYKQAFAAMHERRIFAVKDGPILFLDDTTGAAGHTAYWSLHTPLAPAVGRDRVVTLQGRKTYRLCPAFANEVAEIKREKHWAAVLPRECQPDDCGRKVDVLRFAKPIRDTGARFAIALVEGDGSIEPLGERAFRVQAGASEYVVLCRAMSKRRTAAGGIETDAECACVQRRAGRVVRAWVVAGKRLVIAGTSWLAAAERQTVELKRPVGR